MSSDQQRKKVDERGFFDPQTNTFYKVKNQEIYLKVLEFMEEQQKIAQEEEFQRRLQSERYDDFDQIVQKTLQIKWRPQDQQLVQYDF